MAGIIDSFFVQVGLDASQFTIGQREADKAWTKTKDQTVAAAKQIEENTRRLATSFETLKRIIRKFSKRRLIPRLVDQDRWAQLRRPMDMIRQG